MESEGGGNFKTKKIFVGGLPPTLTEDGFRQYFESYGHVTDVVVTQRPRGFGFITFDSEDAVDREYVKLILDTLNMFIPLVNLYANVPSDAATSELVTVDDELVTSVCWAPDGRHIAVGWNNSQVQIWDSIANRKLRTLRGGHRSGVGSMAWNNHILTTGGHTHEVCGLKWSPSGQQLASGGGDHLLRIWDRRSTQWLHTLEDHTAAVKALVWCPFRGNLLATGEGSVAGCIKFWNTHTGACLNSIDTGSQVSALLWNKNQRELLSSHGFAHFNRIR